MGEDLIPTYLPPVQGVSLSVAEAEAAAIAPARRAMLDALEFMHPTWSEPARVVNDKASLSATLEATAPYNPGATVVWQPIPVRAVWPSESDSGSAPQFQLEVDGVSAYLMGLLDRALGSLVPITMIARRYASDDTSGPARLPVLVMELTEVKVTETRVTATCVYGDPTNNRFPAAAYTRALYPGLSAR